MGFSGDIHSKMGVKFENNHGQFIKKEKEEQNEDDNFDI